MCTNLQTFGTYLNVVEEISVDELDRHDSTSDNEHVPIRDEISHTLPNDLQKGGSENRVGSFGVFYTRRRTEHTAACMPSMKARS